MPFFITLACQGQPQVGFQPGFLPGVLGHILFLLLLPVLEAHMLCKEGRRGYPGSLDPFPKSRAPLPLERAWRTCCRDFAAHKPLVVRGSDLGWVPTLVINGGDLGWVPTSPHERNREGAEAEQRTLLPLRPSLARCACMAGVAPNRGPRWRRGGIRGRRSGELPSGEGFHFSVSFEWVQAAMQMSSPLTVKPSTHRLRREVWSGGGASCWGGSLSFPAVG